MLFEIEQGADSIPVCIVILGRYVLKDELAGRAVIKQMADVADDVAVFVDARGAKIARGAKANDEIVEADRRCGSVVCKCRSWANAQCRGFGQACKWRQRRESKAQRKCSAADGVVFGHNFSIRRVRLCDSFGHYTAQMFKGVGLNCLHGAINRRADVLRRLSIGATGALGIVLESGILAFASYRHKKGRAGEPTLPWCEALGYCRLLRCARVSRCARQSLSA